MKITCVQMDALMTFYMEGELSPSLKSKVEEHLEECQTCRAKYNIITSIFGDMKNSVNNGYDELFTTKATPSHQYKSFKSNLSAYVDNELPPNENIKIKKYTINNKNARNDLEETYKIRKLMKNSYKKTKLNTKSDFVKNIMKQIDAEEKNNFGINPLIKVSVAFVMTVLILSAIIIFSLSM